MEDFMKKSPFIFAAAALLIAPVSRALDVPPSESAPLPTVTDVVSKMTVVVDDLSKTKTGESVQTEQKRVVRDLDRIIAALEKECQGCKNGIKRNNPRVPMQDSLIRQGPGGIGDLVDPRQSEKDWAKLSGRERDRILQSMSEGFPPEYRTVLERYYRRLAAEKTVPSGPAASDSKATGAENDKP
jgi:hypothetical protein